MTNTQTVITMIERELSRETGFIEDMSDAMVFLDKICELLKGGMESESASQQHCECCNRMDCSGLELKAVGDAKDNTNEAITT